MKYITKYNINVILSNIPSLMILILILLKKYSLVSGLIITTICCQLVKKLTNFLPKESIIYRITRRPENGLYCGITCIENKTKKDDPAFPSGHISFVTFFSFCLPNTTIMNIAKLVLISLTAYNRIITKCHTYVQVIGGLFFGYTMNKLLII
jgi:membrane-associated phospholipid phosphatase